jgi:hypothetical protein
MLNGTLCELNFVTLPRTGSGDLFIDGTINAMFNQSYFPLGQFPGCRVGFKESTRHSAKRNSKRYEQVSIEGNRSDPKSGSRKEQKRTASGRRSVLSAAREAKQSSVQTQKAINYPLPLFFACFWKVYKKNKKRKLSLTMNARRHFGAEIHGAVVHLREPKITANLSSNGKAFVTWEQSGGSCTGSRQTVVLGIATALRMSMSLNTG